MKLNRRPFDFFVSKALTVRPYFSHREHVPPLFGSRDTPRAFPAARRGPRYFSPAYAVNASAIFAVFSSPKWKITR